MLTGGSRIYKIKIEIFIIHRKAIIYTFKKSTEISNCILHKHLLYLNRIYYMKNVYF